MSDERITSRENRWFKRFAAAAQRHEDEIVLEGPKQIRDAIEQGWAPIAFALSEDAPSRPWQETPAITFSPALLREITDARHSQGVMALFERPHADPEGALQSGGILVVLDGIQDPGNVGTIVRLAAAFDASAAFLTEGSADPYSLKALRASAGTALLLPLVRMPRSLLLAELTERRIPRFAAAAGPAGELALPRPAALILGSEGQGVSAELLEGATTISIATSPGVESLNVAAAAAILLHRAYRARG